MVVLVAYVFLLGLVAIRFMVRVDAASEASATDHTLDRNPDYLVAATMVRADGGVLSGLLD